MVNYILLGAPHWKRKQSSAAALSLSCANWLKVGANEPMVEEKSIFSLSYSFYYSLLFGGLPQPAGQTAS